MKQYTVDVYTGDEFGCGTNANVFCTIYGDKGDTGERKLAHSETHIDKFERKQMDRFKIDCADLGNVYRIKEVLVLMSLIIAASIYFLKLKH